MKKKILILLTVIFFIGCEKKNFQPTPQIITKDSLTKEEALKLIPDIPIDVFGFRDDTGYGSFRPETAKYFIQLQGDEIYPYTSIENSVVKTKVSGSIPLYKDYDKRFYLIVYPVVTVNGYALYRDIVLEGNVEAGWEFDYEAIYPQAFVGNEFIRFTFHTKSEWDNPDAYVVTATEVKILEEQ